jgi:regulator of protease activity HflC (stomatin/prohibitin superfamily)
VELKSVDLPEQIQRAMGKQAEAEREKRAKVIAAEGELMASQQLLEAADKISQNPVAIQMRYLQTLAEIAVEKNSTIVFPLPVELLRLMDRISLKPE